VAHFGLFSFLFSLTLCRKFDEIVAVHQKKLKPAALQEHMNMLKRGVKRPLPSNPTTNGSSSSSLKGSNGGEPAPKKKKARPAGHKPEAKEPVAVKMEGMADVLMRQLELDERKSDVGGIYFGNGTYDCLFALTTLLFSFFFFHFLKISLCPFVFSLPCCLLILRTVS